MSVTSSHGDEGLVLGCHARPLKLSCVFSAGNHPALAQIPKIFFIQLMPAPEENPIPFFRGRIRPA